MVLYFSSVSALLGLLGEVDYTAANCALDALARARDSERTRHLSLGFGPWQEVGLAVAAARAMGPHSGGDAVRATHLDRRTDWLVGEHVIRGGEAVIPGTGILELFLHALGTPLAGRCAELSDVVFLSPFAVPADSKRTALVRVDGADLALYGDSPRSPSATARGRQLEAPPARSHDLVALRSRCSKRFIATGGTLQQELVDLGPRWSCVRKLGLGDGEALAELELPAPFLEDLRDHPLHLSFWTSRPAPRRRCARASPPRATRSFRSPTRGCWSAPPCLPPSSATSGSGPTDRPMR